MSIPNNCNHEATLSLTAMKALGALYDHSGGLTLAGVAVHLGASTNAVKGALSEIAGLGVLRVEVREGQATYQLVTL